MKEKLKEGFWLVCVLCVALAALPGASQADLITNPGFEVGATPTDGEGAQGSLDGWSILPSGTAAGTHNPSNSQVPGEAHGGIYTAYANDPDDYGGPLAVRQTTATTWQANTVYTLTAYIARRTDLSGSTGQAEFQLRDADLDSAVVTGTYDLSGNGVWNLYTLQYTTSDTDTCLGHVIAVQFRTVSGTQLLYDDISLVPEPSTFILLATGLIGLLAYAWRRRK